MASTTKTFVDFTTPACDADDLNGYKLENNNLITGSGQTLSTADNQQTHKAVSIYAAGGAFYADSGTANAKVLSPIGSKVAPPSYFEGMIVIFEVNATNTGATTVDVNSLGVKNIFNGGIALSGGELTVGDVLALVYDSGNDRFNIIWGSRTFFYNPTVMNAAPFIVIKDTDTDGSVAAYRANVVGQDSSVTNSWAVGRDGSSLDLKLQNFETNNDINLLTAGTGIAKVNGNEISTVNGIARGCLVTRNNNQSIPHNTNTAIVFDTANATEVYDTDSIHDLVTNPTRLTVPTGVTKVRLKGVVAYQSNANASVRQGFIHKNGAAFSGFGVAQLYPNTIDNLFLPFTSAIVDVVGGDYFELIMYQTTGGGAAVNYITSQFTPWFTMEIIK